MSYTKRSLLSTVARLYDPLGIVVPVIMTAKVILKEVWATRIERNATTHTSLEWDETLPTYLAERWKTYLNNLPSIEEIRIPRWLRINPDKVDNLQLHLFCDGSSVAYAACAYLRAVRLDGTIVTHLLATRSRVTPLNPLTIPRVELCGAVLAVQLAQWVIQQLRVHTRPLTIHYWSDATIVLYWISGNPSRWKAFVANRIGYILEHSSASEWKHVSTQENPADCATRGLTPTQLLTYSLWWHGPSWLQEQATQWPKGNFNALDKEEINLEEKITTLTSQIKVPDSIIQNFSSYNRMVVVIAYLRRFVHNSKRTNGERLGGAISLSERQDALNTIVQLVQREAFASEISSLLSNKQLSRSNTLSQFSPFVDQHGVLRIRGRLRHAHHLSAAQRQPIILPATHHFTEIVIRNAHLNTLHGGKELTLATTRHTWWILRGKQAVKRVLRQCVQCFRLRPTSSQQLMGDLPAQRVNPPQRAFSTTGVDFTGALEIRASKFRGNTTYKAYIAVFICLATKAIHLELVTGLTASQFLWALQSFWGRRGLCENMYTDCGTNFISANKSLKLWHSVSIKEFSSIVFPEFTARSIHWHFNPPHSPNFGGLWEANVKAVKTHLFRTFKGTRMTYEQLSTILIQIESCLNSRPLCPLSADPNDFAALTPAHFLIGSSMLAPPVPSDADRSLHTSFLEGQRRLQQFWKHWSKEWLAHLQARPKWRNESPNLQLNDIVIIKDDRLPPCEWKLGRIIEVHPGDDSLVRVASIKTSSGIYKRSVSKICRLPIASHQEELTHQH